MGMPPGKRVYACDVFYWIEPPQNLIRFYFYGFILRDSMKKSMRNSGFHLGKAASCVMVTAIPRIFALKRGVPQCHRAYCAGRPAWPHPNRRRSDYR